MQKKQKIDAILTLLVVTVGTALFLTYAFENNFLEQFSWAQASSVICFALFMVLLYRFIPRLTEYWSKKKLEDCEKPLPRKKKQKKTLILTLTDNKEKYRAWSKICIFILIVKIATYVIAYIAALKSGTVTGGFFETFEKIWAPKSIDALHYIDIAKDWYQTQGDPKYFIVFFPLYPIILAAFQCIVGDYFVAGLLVSTLCSFGIGIVGYELITAEYDPKTAERFIKYIFLLPGAFFYGTVMTESLFVLLCLACFLSIKKRNFISAAVFGMLAAFTRSAGVLLMVPMGVEYIRILVETRRDKKQKKLFWKRLFGLGALVLSVSIGLLAYLYINYTVWGNPMQFSIFQKEHWHQELGYFFHTAKYQVDYVIRSIDSYKADPTVIRNLHKAISLYGSNLIYIHGALIIMILAAKKLREKYTAYFIAYYVFSIGATWLLSGARYLMASVTLPLAIALLSDKRWKDIVWTSVLSVLSVGFIILFAIKAPIY